MMETNAQLTLVLKQAESAHILLLNVMIIMLVQKIVAALTLEFASIAQLLAMIIMLAPEIVAIHKLDNAYSPIFLLY